MIKTDFLNLPVKDTLEERQKRQKAEQATRLFGGSARVSGLGINFSRPSTAPAKTSGTGVSWLDLCRDPSLDLDNK
jgi:hypothetical protein